MGRITLETPAGRRIDLTPLNRRERALRALGAVTAYSVSGLLWSLMLAPMALWLLGR